MKRIILLLVFYVAVTSTMYIVGEYFSGTSCSGSPIYYSITLSECLVNTSCSSSSGQSFSSYCSSNFPSLPSSYDVFFYTWETSSSCSGTANTTTVYSSTSEVLYFIKKIIFF